VGEITGAISAIIGVVGYAPYLVSALRGLTLPHAISWLIWGLLTAVSLTGQVAAHAGPGWWVTAVTMVGCFAVCVVAIIRGGVRFDRTDTGILVGAIVALVLLVAAPDPIWAVVCSNLVGIIGFVPTVRKVIRDPGSEAVSVYAFAAAKFGLALIALDHVEALTALYPALCLAEEAAMVALLLVSRRKSAATIAVPSI
jgi:hypothetical protein